MPPTQRVSGILFQGNIDSKDHSLKHRLKDPLGIGADVMKPKKMQADAEGAQIQDPGHRGSGRVSRRSPGEVTGSRHYLKALFMRIGAHHILKTKKSLGHVWTRDECQALSWKFRKFGAPESRGVGVIWRATRAIGGLKIWCIYKGHPSSMESVGGGRSRSSLSRHAGLGGCLHYLCISHTKPQAAMLCHGLTLWLL